MKKLDIEKVACYDIYTEGFDDPMSKIALVSDPAIQIFGFAFDLDRQKFEFKTDEVRGILVAPTMVPDLKILRYDIDTKEYFTVKFSASTIRDIVEKFHKNKNGQQIKFTHKGEVISATITQSWIKEFDEDKSNAYGFDLQIGTHFVEVKFDDKEWFIKNVLSGEFKGLSIEIDAGLKQLFSIGNFEFNEDELLLLSDQLLLENIGFDIDILNQPNSKLVLENEIRDNNIFIFSKEHFEFDGLSVVNYSDQADLIKKIKENNINIYYSNDKKLNDRIDIVESINISENFEVVTGNADSSNIKSWVYNSKKKTLLITFNDRKKYRYYGISGSEFKNVTNGNASCLTSGSNKFGRWWVGKYSSQGAALYKYVIENGKKYERVYN